MAERRHPSSRAGSKSTARTSARSASNVTPISRNGSVKSQTIGKRISASSARGQQSTKRMHHPIKRIRAFTSLSFHHTAPRQRPAVIMPFWLDNLAIFITRRPLTSQSAAAAAGVHLARALVGRTSFPGAEGTRHRRSQNSATRSRRAAGRLPALKKDWT